MSSDVPSSAITSSSTLWASASKEWIIPAKPKPGRKPKKDPAEVKETQEFDSKGRRVQNRAAQRAFRERKQSQLAELQARVQSYEQGEIERNVALQNIAKKLKEENEQLRKENQTLRNEIERLKRASVAPQAVKETSLGPSPLQAQSTDPRKRWRDEDHESLAVELVSVFSSDRTYRKRQRFGSDSPMHAGTPTPVLQPHRRMYTASPPSFASSPESNDTFSPSPYGPLSVAPHVHSRSPSLMAGHHGSGVAPPPRSTPTPTPTAPSRLFSSSMSVRVSSNVPKSFDVESFADTAGGPSFDGFENCGLCSETTPCVCRELAIQQYNIRHSQAQEDISLPRLEVEITEQKPSIINIPPATEEDSIKSVMSTRKSVPLSRNTPPTSTPTYSSILDNLPAYQPAVPLRRNPRSTGDRATTLFQIRLPSPEPLTPITPTSNTGRPSVRRAATSIASFPGNKRVPRAPSDALCSGDPSNCAACKDDDFGKAFCTALGDSMCSTSPCASCPSPKACSPAPREKDEDPNPSSNVRPSLLRSSTTLPFTSSTIAPKALVKSTPSSASGQILEHDGTIESISSPTSAQPVASGSKMPANEAWRQLKSHPNIAFADLAMLADVVARRTKCSGPVVVVHPPLGSLTPERSITRSPETSDANLAQNTGSTRQGESSPVLLTDPHAHFREQEEHRALFGAPSGAPSVVLGTASEEAALASAPTSSQAPPLQQISLVSQEELRQCGRTRLREVDTAGVNDALRILDAQFGRN